MTTRKANSTLLIVGEGQSEFAFLNHVKKLFSKRGDGKQIKIKNAQGGGAKHIIDWTLRQKLTADYDVVGVIFDTDTKCWNEKVKRDAEKNRIHLLMSVPCLEGMLLRVLGKSDQGDSKELKKRFSAFVKNDSTTPENYEEHFTREKLIRSKEPTIQQLLKLICEKKPE